MSERYEERWRTLPDRLEPERCEQRRAWLLKHVRTGDVVLDVGCGDGAFAEALVGAGADVIGVDVAEQAIARARARVPQARFELWPAALEDGTVDVIWAGEVISRVVDVAAWLSELRRVLRTAGRLLISTPYHGRLKTAAIGFERQFDPRGEQLHHFTRRSLSSLLADFGFEDVRIEAIGGVPLLRSTLLAQGARAGLGVSGASARPA
ncbi:MAG: class I SAM-dependent methyltransferase [Solirubrobacteraceae bacterium]